MYLNLLAVVSQRVMLLRFAVIAAFSYAAVFDLMKNVNRQAGYVSRCRVSGGLVIGLKTAPHWECDLTKTSATFVKQMLTNKSHASQICEHKSNKVFGFSGTVLRIFKHM